LSDELGLPPVITSLYINTAMCYIKLKNWNQAVEYCTKAISKDDECLKAFYRRGVAYMELEEFELS
jgi:hypothetical protein